jgi:hypothetical protein
MGTIAELAFFDQGGYLGEVGVYLFGIGIP